MLRWFSVGFCFLSCLSSLSSADESKIRTLVVLGDSLAAGYSLDPTNAFPAVLQRTIRQAGLDVRVVNAGVSGDTTSGGLRRVDWVLKQSVDVLLLELGGNDGLRGQPVRLVQSNLVAIIRRTREKYPKCKIILAGMQLPANLGRYAEEFGNLYAEVAKETGAALIPSLLEGVGGVPELNLADQIHPTPQGHERVAATVWKTLEPVLREESVQPRQSK